MFENQPIVPIFLAVTGSRLYGNDTPTSDWDYRGVALHPSKDYLGILSNFEQTGDMTKIDTQSVSHEHKMQMLTEDVVIYSFRKFIELAWEANPNILELLFAPSILPKNEHWCMIQYRREYFISQKALHTFSGYAKSQLKKIKNHNKWIQKPLKYPNRSDFDLGEKRAFKKTALKALRSMDDNELLEVFNSEEVFNLFKKEYSYFEALENYKKYRLHIDNRNPERLKLEFKHGYDTKHASHLVRLFYECKRLLETGELVFPLPEIDIVQGVRNGNWSYDKLIEFSDEMDDTLKKICDKSTLPKEPDRKKLDELIQEISFDIACRERFL